MPDRIEAGTWAIAAVMTGGDIEIHDAPLAVLDAVSTSSVWPGQASSKRVASCESARLVPSAL
jgi:UDP-N-acetylglucosamine enolpyruvyl transferase